MKIIFFGTPDFAAHILADLVRAKIDVLAVVTKPDKPQGRSAKLIPPPVRQIAHSLLPSIPVYQPEKCSTPEFAAILRTLPADLYVVVAYGEIMRQDILDIPSHGCVNVHASLLPAYRGAAPIQRCLMNGESESGISIIRLVRKMDAGDIVCMEKIPIDENMTAPELESKLCALGSQLIQKVIVDIESGNACYTEQDHAKATFADKIVPEECAIDWKKPARDIHNLVRAVTPHPGAFCYVSLRGERKRMKVLRSQLHIAENFLPASLHLIQKSKLLVGCGVGALQVLELQVEGKPVMKAEDFLRGILVSDISFFI